MWFSFTSASTRRMMTRMVLGYFPRRISMIRRIAPDLAPPSAPPYPIQVATSRPRASINRASSSCFGCSAMSRTGLVWLRIEHRPNDHLQASAPGPGVLDLLPFLPAGSALQPEERGGRRIPGYRHLVSLVRHGRI